MYFFGVRVRVRVRVGVRVRVRLLDLLHATFYLVL
jgi:hypothetical protein